MRFLYVCALMFLAIFGLVMLVRIIAGALFENAVRRFDITVREDEGIEEFVERARRSPFIGGITIIETVNGGGRAAVLARKYENVRVVSGRKERG